MEGLENSINMPAFIGNNGNNGVTGQSQESIGEISNPPPRGPGSGSTDMAPRTFEMALTETNNTGARNKDMVRGNASNNNTNIPSQARGNNIEMNGQEFMGAVGGGGVGGGDHGDRGCQLSNNGEGNEELSNFKAIIGAQDEDIKSLFEMLGDYKIIIQAVFSLMSTEQLEEISMLYKNRNNEKLEEMIKFSESVRKARDMLSNDSRTSTSINRNLNNNKSTTPLLTTKVRPINGVRTAADVVRSSPAERIRFNEPVANPARDEPVINPATDEPEINPATVEDTQQQLVEARRQQQHDQMRKREDEKRKKNVIIEGIEEAIWGETGDRAVIEDMLREMGLVQRIQELEFIDRIGSNSNGRRPRLIIATFSSVSAAYEITYKGYRLAGSDRFYNVYVRRDLSRTEREEERILRRRRNNDTRDSRSGGGGNPTPTVDDPNANTEITDNSNANGTRPIISGVDVESDTGDVHVYVSANDALVVEQESNSESRDNANENVSQSDTTGTESARDAESVNVSMDDNGNDSERAEQEDGNGNDTEYESAESDSEDESEDERVPINNSPMTGINGNDRQTRSTTASNRLSGNGN